jgi:hypothetical protein
MPRRPPSKAAVALAAAASTDELPIYPRQIERWRQEGLIAESHRVWLGRGRGSRSEYPAIAVDQARAVRRLVHDGVTLRDMPLALFARAGPVTEQALRRRFVSLLDHAEATIKDQPGGSDDFTAAEAMAQGALPSVRATERGRTWRTRLSGSPEPADSILQSVLTNLGLIALTGQATADDALAEVVDAAGGQAVLNDTFAGIGPIATSLDLTAVERALSQLTLDSLRTTAAKAGLDALENARDTVVDVRAFAIDFTAVLAAAGVQGAFGFSELARQMSDVDIALLALGLEACRETLSEELAGLRQLCHDEGRRFSALHRLTEAIPEAVTLPLGVSPDVMSRIDAYFATNPVDGLAIYGEES